MPEPTEPTEPTEAARVSRVVDILVAFDTEIIVETYPQPSRKPDQPTTVDRALIFMVTNSRNVISGQGGADLAVSAQVGDTIRWREANLSLGFEDAVVFYRFLASQGGNLISQPIPLQAVTDSPVPNMADPLHPRVQMITNYFWNSVVLARGRVTYSFYFMLLNRDGSLFGYFQWDPSIFIR